MKFLSAFLDWLHGDRRTERQSKVNTHTFELRCELGNENGSRKQLSRFCFEYSWVKDVLLPIPVASRSKA
jgi:hypothetical protein